MHQVSPFHSSILWSHKHTCIQLLGFLSISFRSFVRLHLNCEMSRFFQKINSEAAFQNYLQNGNRIGKGAVGNVFEAVNRENGKVVAAVKRCELDIYTASPSESDLREVRRRFSHFCKAFFKVHFSD